ncbi:hypothetical protein [Lysobacter sp. D1-1-M9]|uniref:hypothetical protein n=1 Tax=Novilysobacter longmucuonensis TaxID=3098603 RepID=UPI002FC9D164
MNTPACKPAFDTLRAGEGTNAKIIIAALLAAPLLASGQTLYRCVEKGKPTSFQRRRGPEKMQPSVSQACAQ